MQLLWLTFAFLLSFTYPPCLASVIPPQELFNVAHLAFPKDRIAARVVRFQQDQFGVDKSYVCSSLIGPTCASEEAMKLSESKDMFRDSEDQQYHQIKVMLMNQGKEQAMRVITLPVDVLKDLKNEIEVKATTMEEFSTLDPDWIAIIADAVAEEAGFEDKETFKRVMLKQLTKLLTKPHNPVEQGTDANAQKDNDEGENFQLHPLNLKNEVEKETGLNVHMDRAAKLVVNGMSQIIFDQETSQEEEEEEDEYEDVELDD